MLFDDNDDGHTPDILDYLIGFLVVLLVGFLGSIIYIGVFH